MTRSLTISLLVALSFFSRVQATPLPISAPAVTNPASPLLSAPPLPTALPVPTGSTIADADRNRVAGLLSGVVGDVSAQLPHEDKPDNHTFSGSRGSTRGPSRPPRHSSSSSAPSSAPTPAPEQASQQERRAPAAGSSSIAIANTGTTYTARVSIGTPAQTYTLLVDTGSSNTWIGANAAKRYNVARSSTGVDAGRTVKVTYGSGSFQGKEYTDIFSLSSALTIALPGQSFASATSSSGFDTSIDGILGLGPTALTHNTVQGESTVPTVLDNLAKGGTIAKRVFGVGMTPISVARGPGAISFGAPDPGMYTGAVAYAPVPKSGAAASFWGMASAFTYGPSAANATPISSTTSPLTGILDTGTTLMLLATPAYAAYTRATGATLDSATGLLHVSAAQYAAMGSLWVSVGVGAGARKVEVTKDAQRWPAGLNQAIGGKKGEVYLVVSDLGSDGSNGLGFVLGYTFLERYYSVYDADMARVGLAGTKYTNAVVNN